jgi:hypothetical protein
MEAQSEGESEDRKYANSELKEEGNVYDAVSSGKEHKYDSSEQAERSYCIISNEDPPSNTSFLSGTSSASSNEMEFSKAMDRLKHTSFSAISDPPRQPSIRELDVFPSSAPINSGTTPFKPP